MPRSAYLLLNGLRFHYLDWGGSGRPLVLVHGLASSARIWDLVAPQLAGKYRVLALDQRSHGLSDPAEAGWDFATIVRDLLAFVEALDLARPVLVGHSWGASTVLHAAAARPALPAGIVLVDGAFTEMSAVPGLTWDVAEKMLRPPDLDGLAVEDFRRQLHVWLGGHYTDQAADIVLAGFRVDAEDRLYRRLPIPHHMQIARALYEAKTFDLFARTHCPILLCPADPPLPRDPAMEPMVARKREGVERAERQSNVQTRWFHNTPHDIPLFEPEALARAIVEFESRLGP